MTTNDKTGLVERVARAMEPDYRLHCADDCPICEHTSSNARVAIAVVLEEAAKVVETHKGVCDGPDCYEGDSIVRDNAAAIRALNPNDRA